MEKKNFLPAPFALLAAPFPPPALLSSIFRAKSTRTTDRILTVREETPSGFALGCLLSTVADREPGFLSVASPHRGKAVDAHNVA